jgi:hypothetical protein
MLAKLNLFRTRTSKIVTTLTLTAIAFMLLTLFGLRAYEEFTEKHTA